MLKSQISKTGGHQQQHTMGLNSDSNTPLQMRLILVPYFVVLLLCLFVMRQRRPFDSSSRLMASEDRDRVSSFPRQIIAAVVFRIVWALAVISERFKKSQEDTCHDPHAFVSLVSRLSQLVFFSAFSGVLVTWWDVIQAADLQGFNGGNGVGSGSSMLIPNELLSVLQTSTAGPPLVTTNQVPLSVFATLCRPSTLYILGNFWVFLTVVSLVAVEFYVCDSDMARSIDDSETVVVALFYTGLAVGFLYSYSKLKQLLVSREALERKVRLITITCAVLFLERSVLFLLRPIFDVSLRGQLEILLYPNFFFTVPELIPSVVVLWLMIPERLPKPTSLERQPLLPHNNHSNNVAAGHLQHF